MIVTTHFFMRGLCFLFTATFDVQRLEPAISEVTCMFACGSVARGCRVIVTLQQGDFTEHMDAIRETNSRQASVNFTGLQNGTYAVIAFDIDPDGSFSEVPEYVIKFHTITDAPGPTSSVPFPSPSSELTTI